MLYVKNLIYVNGDLASLGIIPNSGHLAPVPLNSVNFVALLFIHGIA